ncbi:cytochrome P450 [Aspergillus avenaceus]|uniref:Cytochrome P450 n=1 Tax=Aspergillus avenaceus TaxID=36643 RepID=A0A5N6TYG6_ASPAV|nr:cytochrome P450 [Aspergillus avenaceus]
MDYTTFLQALVSSLLCYWVGWILYARWLHPLSKFPGPPLAAISRIWTVLHVLRGKAQDEQKALHQKYGPIVRIAPDELAISDPRAVKAIYGVNSGFKKTDFYLPFRSPFARYPDHFTATDEKSHASRRKIVHHIYSLTSILQAEEYVDKCTDLFLQCLGEMADAQTSVDLLKWARMYAYDVVGEFYFGQMFGFLKNKDDHIGYLSSTDSLIPVMTLSAVMPSYVRSIFMLGGFMFSRMRKAVGAFDVLTKAADLAVENRRHLFEKGDVSQRKPDLLTRAFEIYYRRGVELDFQLIDLKMEAFGAFFGGSDTSAIAISGTMYHIIRNEQAYRTLVEEIDQATRDGKLSMPHLMYNEAVKLPYLDACIKEGMRIHPSVGLTMPRHTPAEGAHVAGYWVPGNTRIGINPAVLQKDTSVFGDDAEVFRPDRWLETNAHQLNQYILQFGGGSRTCMGKHMALCELYKIIPEILRSFHLSLESSDTLKTSAFWFYKPASVHVRVRRRSDN